MDVFGFGVTKKREERGGRSLSCLLRTENTPPTWVANSVVEIKDLIAIDWRE